MNISLVGSPDLDLAMAVEMSQLYGKSLGATQKLHARSTDLKYDVKEEEEISMAIELSFKDIQKKKSRFSTKSMSTDGAEGELRKNVQDKVPVKCDFHISEEANATVR